MKPVAQSWTASYERLRGSSRSCSNLNLAVVRITFPTLCHGAEAHMTELKLVEHAYGPNTQIERADNFRVCTYLSRYFVRTRSTLVSESRIWREDAWQSSPRAIFWEYTGAHRVSSRHSFSLCGLMTTPSGTMVFEPFPSYPIHSSVVLGSPRI